ncbi:MAG: T9SS type A sorting domain-containing protein [Bacteroidota bacterium]
MNRTITLFFFSLLIFVQSFAQDKYNLDPTTTSRFTVTDKIWPANIGEADVCLWNDDKLSAFTLTIDDNNEADISFWKSMIDKYGFNFTWFVITEADSQQYNVGDWQNFRDLATLGSQVNGHDDRNWYNDTSGGETNPTPAEYLARLQATQTKINTEVTTGNNECLTYAYPYGEGNVDEARKVFISIRGTNGVLNLADKVDYLDVNSVSSPHIYKDDASRDTYILPLLDKTSTLWGSNYYRGWGSTHFHAVSTEADRTTADEFLQYLKNKEDLWVDGFTNVAQYAQSFATHNLVVDNVAASEIKFTLTDQMMDAAFYFPLTVKIRVDNTWVNVSATQNGVGADAEIITHNGNKYALVKAVPDKGQVTLTGVADSDPAIITPTIEDKTMIEGESLQVDFSASTSGGDVISFTVENLPGFGTFTDNDNNSGKIVFNPALFDAGAYQNITVIANNGRSITSESFQLTVTPDASAVAINASKQDAAVYFPEHGWVDPNDRTFAIAGGGYVEDKQMSAVFPFQLPEPPAGKVVVSAKFQVNLESFNQPENITGKLDLYGLPARTAATVLVTDAYAGTFDGDANATGLQQDFANKSTPLGIVETSNGGNDKLIEYLNKQYETANTGDYVFIRISNDDLDQSHYARTFFTTADGAEANSLPYPSLLIEFGEALAVEEVEKGALGIYPNPVKDGKLNISLDGFNENANLFIYSITGNLVYQKPIKPSSYGYTETNLNLNSGLYIVRLTNGIKSKTQKLIIQ